ncbi:hypothetical protein HJFPF1_02528 [Paramyrothecium foliicola]|nr:hypothetical protein HJFPF1_02528 [Paramyrothecium foliicola]
MGCWSLLVHSAGAGDAKNLDELIDPANAKCFSFSSPLGAFMGSITTDESAPGGPAASSSSLESHS